jgi:hypothetical protein
VKLATILAVLGAFALAAGAACDGGDESSQTERTGTEQGVEQPAPTPTPTISCRKLLAPDSGATGVCRKPDGQTLVVASSRRALRLQDLRARVTLARRARQAGGETAAGTFAILDVAVKALGKQPLDWGRDLDRRVSLLLGANGHSVDTRLSRKESGSSASITPGKEERLKLVFPLRTVESDALTKPGSFLQIISSAELAARRETRNAATVGRIRLWR